MYRTKLLLYIIILNSSFLVGCSNHSKIDKLTSDIQTLNVKIDQINNDMNTLQADIQDAKEDAIRANQRLDNHISSDRK